MSISKEIKEKGLGECKYSIMKNDTICTLE
jgi:hypothetical protein